MSEPRPVTGSGNDGLDPLGDGERLPWLEPYREGKSAPPPPPSRTIKAPVSRNAAVARPRFGLLLTGALAAGLLAAGGYWFGRESLPRDVDRPQSTVIAPLPPAAAPIQLPNEDRALPYRSLGEGSTASPTTTAETPRRPRVQPAMRRVAKSAVRVHRHAVPPPRPNAPPQPRIIADASIVIAEAPKDPTAPTGKVRASPLPVTVPPPSVGQPGDVVELGVFISRATAQRALRRMVRRYPYLGTRPKMILSQPPTAGWPQVYRLRLGTGSARNAKILCRYVHTIGKRCSVV